MYYVIRRDSELYHYGIKGQKHGVRRYQNEDGSLTPAGRIHYGVGEKMRTNDPNDSAVTRRVKREYNTLSDEEFRRKAGVSKEVYRKRVNKYGDPYMNSPLAKAGKRLAGVKGKNADKYAKKELDKIANSDSEKTKSQKENTKKAIKIGLGIAAGLAAVTLSAITAGQLSYKKGKKVGQDEAWNDAADYSREISALRRKGQLWGDYNEDIKGLKLRDAGIDVFEPDLFGRYNKRTGRLE